jgi:GST-like protein
MALKLYFWPTANGIKIPIMLEELDIPFESVPLNIRNGEHKTAAFAALNPNVKIPVLVVEAANKDLVLNESAAILTYLAEREGRFLPRDSSGRQAVLAWLFWHAAHQVPTLGLYQRLHEQIPEQAGDALRRTVLGDVAQIYRRLENQLAHSAYVAGEYSIADIAVYPWIQPRRQGQDIASYPNLQRWYETVRSRPAVIRAYDFGQKLAPTEKSLQDWR